MGTLTKSSLFLALLLAGCMGYETMYYYTPELNPQTGCEATVIATLQPLTTRYADPPSKKYTYSTYLILEIPHYDDSLGNELDIGNLFLTSPTDTLKTELADKSPWFDDRHSTKGKVKRYHYKVEVDTTPSQELYLSWNLIATDRTTGDTVCARHLTSTFKMTWRDLSGWESFNAHD